MITAPDIPGYRVGAVLGTGGFATVYRSWQLAVGREVAVKVDNRVLLTERDQRRFLREVTAAGRLSGHPHVIDVYDAGMLEDGRPYLVMELCPAGSLNDALRRHGPMGAAQVRDIGVALADALAAAHAASVLHRDIKPANILVNRYGMVGLSDFGLASIIAATGEQTASREALTPAYAPPESFRGEEPTALGDVYSLAATLYSLLAGRPPRFGTERPPSLATIMMLHDRPVDDVPGTPQELMGLLRRSLAPDPAARPQGAAEFRDALAGRTIVSPSALVHEAAPAVRPAQGRPAGLVAPGATSSGPGNLLGGATGYPPEAPVTGPPRGAAPGGDVGSGAWTGTGRPLGPGAAPGTGAGPAHRPGPAPGTGAGAAWRTGGGEARVRRGRVRRGRAWRLAGLAAGVVVIAVGAALAGARLAGHATGHAAGRGTPAARGTPAGGGAVTPEGVFGIATVTAGCPAASVRGAGARCPATPECWGGMVVISGAASARSVPCTQPHDWQTFAIAILPSDARTFDQPTLEENPTVRAVCSIRVLLRSRRGRSQLMPASRWRADVLPPTEAAFDSGARAYRCVANLVGSEPRTSQFGR